MSLEPTDLCPGGNLKKIKFCCPDLAGELKKIGRMLEGKQYQACLQHVERLVEKHPERACLLAAKGLLLRLAERLDDAVANAERFRTAHPDNPAAWAESAICAAMSEQGREAMGFVQKAIHDSRDGMPNRVYDAMGIVAEALLAEGEWQAARGLLQLQLIVDPEDSRPVQTIMGMNRSASVPLVLKEDLPLGEPPDDAPWKERFIDAMEPLRHGSWQGALERFEALAADVSDSPLIWRHMARLRAWVADTEGSREALRRFAELTSDLEDAVEAEAAALHMADDPLGDALEVFLFEWTVSDAEPLLGELGLTDRAVKISVDHEGWGGADSAPPKGSYVLLDQATPASAEGLTLEAIPRILGQAFVFGKQTDRDARLEVVGVVANESEAVKELVARIGGDAVQPDMKQETLGEVSASHRLLERRWRVPRDVTREQVEQLTVEHLDRALLQEWTELKLGALDGRSPREAAGDEQSRARLLAVVMVLKDLIEHELRPPFDFNRLRRELGLPEFAPIDPAGVNMAELPLVRLERIEAEKADDDALRIGFRRSIGFAAVGALPQFAREVARRESFQGSEEQMMACQLLARLESEPDEALKYIDQGRRAAEAAGQSSARWDLMELSAHFARQDVNEVNRLLAHLEAHHMREPGVADEVVQMLVQAGVMNPDGTPAVPTDEMAADAPQAEAAGKLWTPDSETGGGGGKLWTPD
jgi:tetratricopeptide (TPR) repeat protein